MNAWMLPNSVASNKRPSPSIKSALFMINARALNRMLRYIPWHQTIGVGLEVKI